MPKAMTVQREATRKRARDDEAQPLLESTHPSNKLRLGGITTTAKGYQQGSHEQVYPWPQYNNQCTEMKSITSHLMTLSGTKMTTYGTLTPKKEYGSLDFANSASTMEESVRSNQSDTESDSEGSNCHESSGRNSNGSSSSSDGVLPSILRIRSEGFICTSSTKKQGSVEFAIDIDEDEEEVTEKKRAYSCGTGRCYPR
jgi:hypothetical protein